MKKRWLWEFGALLALSLNYSGIHLLPLMWKIELPYYLLLVFVVSLMFGALLANLAKATIYMIVSQVLGGAFAVAIVGAPLVAFGVSFIAIDAAIELALSSVAKLLLFSVILGFAGIFTGCFLGETLTEQTRFSDEKHVAVTHH